MPPESDGADRRPRPGHQPVATAPWSAPREAIRTRQFWLLWVVLFCNVTAGIGILEQAAPMIQDFFREGDTSTVTAAAAGGFVGVLSLANMAGRFVWSSTSDVIGRKPIYMVYLGVGIVAVPAARHRRAHARRRSSSLLAAVILSFYGGGFATVPAYLKDLFGTLEVGAIHGRLLTAWSAAGVAGPLVVNGFLDAAGKPGTLTDGRLPAGALHHGRRARRRLRRQPAGHRRRPRALRPPATPGRRQPTSARSTNRHR